VFSTLNYSSPARRFWSALAGISVAVLIGFGVAAPLLRPQVRESPPLARTQAEKKILDTLDDVVKAGELYANVPPSDGRLLRVLAEAVNARNVVEIGTSTGVSGLWLCLALERTGGKLNTFELDAGRAATARRHFQQAGVDRLVNLVEGDAHRNLESIREPVDLAFIDAEKPGYPDYLKQLLPLVRPGGLILAHNVNMVPEYVAAVTRNPELETVFYMQGGGMAVTIKKR
jgi:predicted O-methyltransferase YrrM